MDRDSKGKFLAGHRSYATTRIGNRLIEWTCENCSKFTSKTLKELRYERSARRFCSIDCSYQYGTRTGMKSSVETRQRLSIAKLGENNPSWRGGVTHPSVALRNTPEYKEWRKQVLLRDDATCRGCGTRNAQMEADHIVPYYLAPERLLDLTNGQTLCKKCHRNKSSSEMKLHWKNQYGSSRDLS